MTVASFKTATKMLAVLRVLTHLGELSIAPWRTFVETLSDEVNLPFCILINHCFFDSVIVLIFHVFTSFRLFVVKYWAMGGMLENFLSRGINSPVSFPLFLLFFFASTGAINLMVVTVRNGQWKSFGNSVDVDETVDLSGGNVV